MTRAPSLEADKCETGCAHFSGGEVRHHRDCVHYPESLTRKYDALEAQLAAADRLADAAERYKGSTKHELWKALAEYRRARGEK